MDSKQGFNACLRCKARKIKCDRETPKCTNCEKANMPCLTTDPATGRQVPRSYLNHLENRVQQLERELELSRKCISTGSPHIYIPEGTKVTPDQWPNLTMASHFASMMSNEAPSLPSKDVSEASSEAAGPQSGPPHSSLTSHDIGSRSSPAAVQRSLYSSKSPRILPIELPSKQAAENMIRWFFEQSNSAFPVLHREQFIQDYFEPVYGHISPQLKLCSKYTTLNLRTSSAEPGTGTFYRRWVDCGNYLIAAPEPRIQRCLYFLYITFAVGSVTNFSSGQEIAEQGTRYFSAALTYYPMISRSYVRGNGFTGLQAILLLALYSIMRPSSPGAWYTVGDAMRMCIDMGLHKEQSINAGSRLVGDVAGADSSNEDDSFTVDMRRRLFWTAYAMDRVVSISLGRPSSIRDDYIECKLPSLVDDSWFKFQSQNSADATPEQNIAHIHYVNPDHRPSSVYNHQLLRSSSNNNLFDPPNRPSYKWVFYCQLILRKIQYRVRETLYDRVNVENVEVMRKARNELAAELQDWYDSTPRDKATYNFDWNTDTFEIGYHYTRVLLFRNSRGIPEPNMEESRFLIDAGIKMLKLYVNFSHEGYIVCPWGIVHNVLQTATACLYALLTTDALNYTYDIDELEAVIIGVIGVLNKLRISTEVAALYCEPLVNMAKITVEYLRNPDNKKRKRSGDADTSDLEQASAHYQPPHHYHYPDQPQSQSLHNRPKINLPPIDVTKANLQPINTQSLSAPVAAQALAPESTPVTTPASDTAAPPASPPTQLSAAGPAPAPAPAPCLPQPPQPPPQALAGPEWTNVSMMPSNIQLPPLSQSVGYGPGNVPHLHPVHAQPSHAQPSKPQLPIPVQQHHIQAPDSRMSNIQSMNIIPPDTHASSHTHPSGAATNHTGNTRRFREMNTEVTVPQHHQQILPSFSSLQLGISADATSSSACQPAGPNTQQAPSSNERESAKAQMQGLFNSVAKIFDHDHFTLSRTDREPRNSE